MQPLTSETRRRGERGNVLVWTALFMLIMLMFVALGVDTAKIAATRSQLQNAADAAALAGASATGTDASGNRRIIASIAKSRAYATAHNNGAYTNAETAVAIDTVNDVVVTDTTVWVKTRRESASGTPMLVQFAQVVGITSFNVSAQATAKLDIAGGVCGNLVPFGVLSSSGPFIPGCAHVDTLKEKNNYGPLDFGGLAGGNCGGGGASQYRCYIEQGYSGCLSITPPLCLDQKPGNNSGPTRQGVQYRFNQDTDQREGICYSDYTGNGKRVVITPIVVPGTGACAGSDYKVVGFAAFFLKYIPGNGGNSDVIGEYIGEAGGSQGGGSTGTVFAIRLIR